MQFSSDCERQQEASASLGLGCLSANRTIIAWAGDAVAVPRGAALASPKRGSHLDSVCRKRAG